MTGLRKKGFEVFASDIDEQSQMPARMDFLKNIANHFDCIVTNPPFSLKEEFLGRCYQLRKPFALLMPITTFDSKERRKMMRHHGVEIVLPDRRINFETPNQKANLATGKKTQVQFYCAWFTWGFNIGREMTFTDKDETLPGL